MAGRLLACSAHASTIKSREKKTEAERLCCVDACEQLKDRNVSSYVTDVSGTSAGPFHWLSDVDIRTASQPGPQSVISDASPLVFSVAGVDVRRTSGARHSGPPDVPIWP